MTVGRVWILCLACLAIVVGLAPRSRAFDYDEGVSGDLSEDPNAPTTLSVAAGANTLAGSAGAGEYDVFHITLGAGQTLNSILLDDYQNPVPSVSFMGLVTGSTWTTGFDGDVDPGALLGWTHFGFTQDANIGDNLLIPMSTAPLTDGFTRPLGAGEYTFMIQDTDTDIDYAMTFNVSGGLTPGDFNGDHSVNALDLEKFKNDFPLGAGSDADGDTDTDGNDVALWQRHLNMPTGVESAVPEPSTGLLAAAALLLAARRRR